MKFLARVLLLAAVPLGVAAIGHAQQHGHPMPQHHGAADAADARVAVDMPPMLRAHMLANMRDHMAAVQEILDALARDDAKHAAAVAEERLGMSSLPAHGAHDVAPFMPPAMQEIGTAMHRAASRFAVTVRDAEVAGDLRRAIDGVAQVTAQCVACHAAYRVK